MRTLMQEHPRLNTLARLTAETGISNGTLDRIRRAEVATTVDTLEQLAGAYGLEAWELLVPPEKRRLLHQLRLVAEAAAEYSTHPAPSGPDTGPPPSSSTGARAKRLA